MKMNIPSEKTRAYIYRVLVGLGAVALTYGLLSANEIATWLGLAGIVFNVMPTANTTTKDK